MQFFRNGDFNRRFPADRLVLTSPNLPDMFEKTIAIIKEETMGYKWIDVVTEDHVATVSLNRVDAPQRPQL